MHGVIHDVYPSVHMTTLTNLGYNMQFAQWTRQLSAGQTESVRDLSSNIYWKLVQYKLNRFYYHLRTKYHQVHWYNKIKLHY